ncbi:hypothetical protein AV530_004545 [Patagioenas fasciata monilis]|uniref:Uncharacterized protein n=1 Tax=Patagioenas fasciata monilis TaxID=372326 RepID=A0A1V4J6X7_PATFA|nr:hypothetical protein AV530_004545 [Patagioenas fasciata monilis]
MSGAEKDIHSRTSGTQLWKPNTSSLNSTLARPKLSSTQLTIWPAGQTGCHLSQIVSLDGVGLLVEEDLKAKSLMLCAILPIKKTPGNKIFASLAGFGDDYCAYHVLSSTHQRQQAGLYGHAMCESHWKGETAAGLLQNLQKYIEKNRMDGCQDYLQAV